MKAEQGWEATSEDQPMVALMIGNDGGEFRKKCFEGCNCGRMLHCYEADAVDDNAVVMLL